MNGSFRVVWRRRLVEHELAEFVLAAMGRQEGAASITRAMNEIDRLLATAPQTHGESREDYERILIVPPLAVDYEVYEDDRVVYVLRARYLPQKAQDN
jgi:hypothetical protein